MRNLTRSRTIDEHEVSATRLLVMVEGTLVGLTGMVHGLFEIMQGNRSTGGYLLAMIGAFTLIHNYLLTGIATVCIGLALVAWTIGFIHKKNGPIVFLSLAIFLFLVGGGFAHIVMDLITFGVSTRINRPLTWWKKVFSSETRARLAKSWMAFFVTGYLFFLTGIGIWLIFTPPGTVYEEHYLLYWACWSALFLGLALQMLTIVSGFARDIERMEQI